MDKGFEKAIRCTADYHSEQKRIDLMYKMLIFIVIATGFGVAYYGR